MKRRTREFIRTLNIEINIDNLNLLVNFILENQNHKRRNNCYIVRGKYLIEVFSLLVLKENGVKTEKQKELIDKFLISFYREKIKDFLLLSTDELDDKFQKIIMGIFALIYERNGLKKTFDYFVVYLEKEELIHSMKGCDDFSILQDYLFDNNFQSYRTCITNIDGKELKKCEIIVKEQSAFATGKTENEAKQSAARAFVKKYDICIRKHQKNSGEAYGEIIYPVLKKIKSDIVLEIFSQIGIGTEELPLDCMYAVLIKVSEKEASDECYISQAFFKQIGEIAIKAYESNDANYQIGEKMIRFIPKKWFESIIGKSLTDFQRIVFFKSLIGGLIWTATILDNKNAEQLINKLCLQSVNPCGLLHNETQNRNDEDQSYINDQIENECEWNLQRLICELSKNNIGEKIFAKVTKNNLSTYDIGIWNGKKRKNGIIFSANESKQFNEILNQILPYNFENQRELDISGQSLKKSKKNEVKKEVISGEETQLTAHISPGKKLMIIEEEIKNKNTFADYMGNSNKLMPHQKAGCRLAELFDRFAFYYDTGTGKTVLALDIMASKFQKQKVHFLVISPKAIIQTAWMNDQMIFYPKMKLAPLSANISFERYQKINRTWNGLDGRSSFNDYLYYNDIQKGTKKEELEYIRGIIMGKADHFIINPESFIRRLDFIEKLNINGLIVDESSILKNYSSKTTQAIRVFAQKCMYVYLLSGKPAPNNAMEYYSQMKIIAPEDFKESHDTFKQQYFLNVDGRIQFRSIRAQKEVVKRIAEHSLFVTKEDCLNLPETTNVIRNITLDQKIRVKYESMYRDYFIQIEKREKESKEKNVIFNANNKLASLMKLRQLVSGFIMDSETKDITVVHKKREDELLNTIDEIGDQQIIIWCQFKYEISHLKEVLTQKGKCVVTANSNTKDLDSNIAMFKSGMADIMLAHPKTLQYGVTLTNCTYAIYYSLSYSFEEYYQSHDRIYRFGQVNKCTYIFLQVEDTIDEIIYKCVMEKKDSAEVFEMLIRDARRRKILR